MCNVGIATTGFDCPDIEVVIVNKSTTSLTLWLQMVGRGGRPYNKGTYVKPKFICIDLGNNAIELGEWQADRNWTELFFQKYGSKNGVAPMKVCPQCEGIVHAAVRYCPLPLPQLEVNFDSGNANGIDMAGDGNTVICNHYFEPKLGTDNGNIELVELSETHGATVSKYEIHNPYLQKEIKERMLNSYKDGIYQLWYYCCSFWKDKFKRTEDNHYLNACYFTYKNSFSKSTIPESRAMSIAKGMWDKKYNKLAINS